MTINQFSDKAIFDAARLATEHPIFARIAASSFCKVFRAKAEMYTYYVYILFDWRGIPRYVGKGTGSRLFDHERIGSRTNWMLNEFIERTWIMLGEIPKIKVIKELTHEDALKFEIIFIKAIGRHPNGPLTNMTNGGEGFDPDSARKANTTWISKSTFAQRSAIAKKASTAARLTITPDQLSEITRQQWANMSAEERERHTKRLREQSMRAATTLTPQEHGKRVSHGVRTKLTPEERSDNIRKAAAKMTPENRHKRGMKAGTTRRKRRLIAENGLLTQSIKDDLL